MGLSPERVFLVERAEMVAIIEGNIMKIDNGQSFMSTRGRRPDRV